MIFFNFSLIIICLVTYTNHLMVFAILTQQNNTPENTTQPNLYRKASRVQHSRTLQRLVGGHRQNPFVHKQLNHNSTLKQNSKIYFRRKTLFPTIENEKNNSTLLEIQKSNSSYDIINLEGLDNIENSIESLDYSASSRSKKEDSGGGDSKKDESKKTLSDQVAEGKYGLIEKELFETKPKRLGVLSYSGNPEVSKDNSNNFGGIKKDEIWLAEGHLLVLKGGSLNNMQKDEPWQPINNYEAPKRPVVLPPNPKVPPPFPVQLTENGPIQFIGNNQFSVFNPITNESIVLLTKEGFPKAQTNDNNQKNLPAGYPKTENFTNPNSFPYNYPAPPPLSPLNGDDPNQPDFYDEDDPSLYYPPPYSFIYKSNYTNLVPPGPLVPGIILPPPPSFFSLLGDVGKANQIIKLDRINEATQKSTPKTSIEVTKEKILSVGGKISKDDISKLLGSGPTKSTTTTCKPSTIKIQNAPKPDKTRTVLTKVPPKQYNTQLKLKPPPDVLDDGKKPVYFEYFDARTTNKPFDVYGVPPNYQTTTPASRYYASTPKTIQRPMFKQKITTQSQPNIQYLPPVQNNQYDKYLYITPKPNLKLNSLPADEGISMVTYQPLQQSFDYEVKSIKNTLKYYKNRQQEQKLPHVADQQMTQIQRTPKAKAVYEYSFDATNNGQSQSKFVPPTQMDTTPFRPIVQYSKQMNFPEQYNNQQYYYTTPTPFVINSNPIQATTKGYDDSGVTHPAYLYYSASPKAILTQGFSNYGRDEQTDYSTKPTIPQYTGRLRQEPWLSIEKQVFREVIRRPPPPLTGNSGRLYKSYRPYPDYADQYNNQYQYERPQNQQYYQPQQPYPEDGIYIKNVNQNPRDAYKQEISQNSTFFSYRNVKQPILNQNIRQPQLQQQPQRYYPNNSPPPIDYSYDYTYHKNNPNQNQAPPWPSPSLHRDILVNYKYPLPPINSDAELLPMP